MASDSQVVKKSSEDIHGSCWERHGHGDFTEKAMIIKEPILI